MKPYAKLAIWNVVMTIEDKINAFTSFGAPPGQIWGELIFEVACATTIATVLVVWGLSQGDHRGCRRVVARVVAPMGKVKKW